MTQIPIFTVYSRVRSAPKRLQWLREIYDSASRHVNNDPDYLAKFWPGSIIRIDCMPERMTVHWCEFIGITRFKPAFAAAWNELGDNRPVEHVALDVIFDDGQRRPERGA